MADPITTQPRCPECGTPAAEEAACVPWWYRRRWVFQAIGLLAFATFLGVMQWRHPLIAPNVHNVPPGTHAANFPILPITRADVEAMAAAGSREGDGDQLLRTIGESLWMSGRDDLGLEAAFVLPMGEGYMGKRWGWPVDVVSRHYSAVYKDVFARTGMTAPNLRGRVGWMYDAWWDEGQDPVFGRWTLIVKPDRVGASVGLIVLAWLLGSLVARACVCAFPRTRLGRGAAMLPWTCAAVVLAIVLALSVQPQTEAGFIPAAPPWPQTGGTGLTLGDLRALRDAPGADRTVARSILAGAATVPTTGEYLAWGWRIATPHSSRQIMGLWPISLFDGHAWDIHPLDGSQDRPWARTRWQAEMTRGNLVFHRKEVGGLERVRRYTISLSPLSWCLLGLYGSWLAPAIPVRLAMWRRRRRARLRVARGQCARCGYDGVRAEENAAESPSAA